jgi:hypothetical protein
MKRHGDNPIPCAGRSGCDVFVSQSQKWLTERFAYLPQVRLVFGEKLPRLSPPIGNFEGLQGFTALRC